VLFLGCEQKACNAALPFSKSMRNHYNKLPGNRFICHMKNLDCILSRPFSSGLFSMKILKRQDVLMGGGGQGGMPPWFFIYDTGIGLIVLFFSLFCYFSGFFSCPLLEIFLPTPLNVLPNPLIMKIGTLSYIICLEIRRILSHFPPFQEY